MTEIPVVLHRLLGVSVLLFLGLATGTALLRTEVVVTGHGRLVPEGPIALVQPQSDGRVVAVEVAEGDQVHEGDLLAEMDPRTLNAEQNILEIRLAQLSAEDRRLAAQLDVIAGRSGADAAQAAVDGADQRGLITSILNHRAKVLAVLDIRIDGLHEALATLAHQRTILEQEATLRDERLTALRMLQGRGSATAADMLEAQAARLRSSTELAALEADRTRLHAALAEARAEREATDARLEADWMIRRREIAAETGELAERIQSLRAQREGLLIKATADGVVTDLAPGFQGRALMRGETVMRIVPAGGPLIAEIDVASQDIGFIRSGQAASLKIDAFPFQRFGVVAATVTYVSADAQRSETGGWHYRVRLSVDAGPLPFADELRSGMTLHADLIVGERRLLTYLLGPILRLTGESFREI